MSEQDRKGIIYKKIRKSGASKKARATAIIQAGTGRIRINHIPIEILKPDIARRIVLAPLILAGKLRDHVDINVFVSGGGYMGQAQASSIAISRAMVKWFDDYKPNPEWFDIRGKFIDYDRMLLKGDPRQKEKKKFGGIGARRRKQKSYR